MLERSGDTEAQLVLCVPKGWDSYISCEFYELQLELARLGWKKLVIGETDDATILSAIKNARAVLLWEAYELLERHESFFFHSPIAGAHHPHKIFFCDDVHFFDLHRRQQRLRAFNWANTILATYPDKLQKWYPEIPTSKIKWAPHSA